MKTVGLITEYNPFHNGHLYHLKKAKELTHADYVIVLMSGNFVQRGTPAFLDKYTRTRMALSQGADLVFELPLSFATGSAEFFASGAISIFRKLGTVDSICFGAETGNLKFMQSLSNILIEEPDAYKTILSHFLKTGLSFPAARKKALFECLKKSCPSLLEKHLKDFNNILESPNNILGIEYLKALTQQQSSIKPYILQRTAASGYHKATLNKDCISSATSIRSQYLDTHSLDVIAGHVPKTVFTLLKQTENQSFPITENDFSQMLYYALSCQTSDILSTYLDVSNDLAKRMKNHLYHFESFSSFAFALKTKTYTLTRIYRALLHILLQITKYDISNSSSYVRLLGMRKTASPLLKQILQKIEPDFTIIQKPAAAQKILNSHSLTVFEKEIAASHLYQQVIYNKFQNRFPMEYQNSLILM